jgi:hypothetical protein
MSCESINKNLNLGLRGVTVYRDLKELLSLVANLLREQRVAGSNPVIPTSIYRRTAFPG